MTDDRPRVFVFGSNQAGRHGAGAAYTARWIWGAEYGVGRGFMRGNIPGRHTYAIPTKNASLVVLPKRNINEEVDLFLTFARLSPELLFLITRIGCGLAGYQNKQIAPMFAGAAECCQFDPAWAPFGLKSWEESPDEYVRNHPAPKARIRL